jgi:hypothetical protein
MAKYIMAVRSNAVLGREAEFNEWYDRVLLPQMVRSPTLISGQRYRVAPVALPMGLQKAQHEYLAVYQIESENLQETVQQLWSSENMARIQPSTALDYSSVDCQFYLPMGPTVIR